MAAGVLVAPQRGLVLWGKLDQSPHPIASMTKLMTLVIAFDQLARFPSHTLDSRVRISKAAEEVNERQIWLRAGDVHPLRKLMQASLIHSANDASHALAEALAPGGDIHRFIVMMNVRARKLGMPTARFYNVHGLPGRQDNRASPRDIATLALEARKIPHLQSWARVLHSTFVHNNGKKSPINNTNRRLLQGCRGVTGLKTGYTNRAGSCVVATCERDGELLIAVAMGFQRSGKVSAVDKRTRFVSGLFDWGYATLRQPSSRNR